MCIFNYLRVAPVGRCDRVVLKENSDAHRIHARNENVVRFPLGEVEPSLECYSTSRRIAVEVIWLRKHLILIVVYTKHVARRFGDGRAHSELCASRAGCAPEAGADGSCSP